MTRQPRHEALSRAKCFCHNELSAILAPRQEGAPIFTYYTHAYIRIDASFITL
jgi:hypothetical protein